jgi:hypothetical protein
LLATTSGGGGALLPITFDTRWGTATDAATGWITFGLPVGNKRTWVDSAKADDTGDGLTAATAKKTLAAGWTVFTTGWTAGDQIMLAGGTAGGTYNDMDNGTSLTLWGGTGPSVMTVVQSYDRADPTGAVTPYGQLVGSAMPVFNLLSVNSTFFNVVNLDGKGYVAVKGLEIKAAVTLAATSLGISWATNKHPGQVYQNVRFNGTGFANSSGLGTTSAATNTPNGGLLSKSSMWNSVGVFIEETDGWRVEEFFTANCGWNIGSVRDDPVTYGGPSVFTHALYLHASNTNMQAHRVICADATDGLGTRCGFTSASQLISIDNPVGLTAGGKSSDVVAERPDGAPYNLDDAVIMGSEKEIQPGNPGGWGLEFLNTINGSYARNVAAFDFDAEGFDSGFNRYFAGTRLSASQVPTYMLADKWSGFDFAITGESDSIVSGDPANYHLSITNSVLDVLPAGFNGAVTNVTTRSVAPTGYKTRAQIYAALGYANKAGFVNAMLYRPDLIGTMAQAISGIALPAMGLSPLYQTASPPAVVSGPTIYPTAPVDLTPSTLSFARGVPSIMVLSGATSAARLSSSDLPSGFSMTPFRLQTSGTATSGSHTITAVGSITGVLPGMLVEMRSSAYAPTSLFPAGTVVTAASGTTITCSNAATANSSGESVFVSAGGRIVSYDGSGTGAATPTIHIVETPKDTTMAPHTTALTLTIS